MESILDLLIIDYKQTSPVIITQYMPSPCTNIVILLFSIIQFILDIQESISEI